MDTINYTQARAELAPIMDKLCADHAPVKITRRGAETVVMISLDDYEALTETAAMARHPKLVKRLVKAIKAFRKDS